MGHMVVFFAPAVCKNSESLSKERILELNATPLHILVQWSHYFRVFSDSARCNGSSILRISFLHSFGFPEIKAPNVTP